MHRTSKVRVYGILEASYFHITGEEMTTKEKILEDIDNLDEDELEAFHELVKQFLQTRQWKPAAPSLLEQLSRIQIDGPEDFAENIDLYLTGEKQFDPNSR